MTGDPTQLVEGFGSRPGNTRFESYQALVDLGADALPALREGLRSPDWQVRRWSAICLDHVADAAALADLVPLLRDPHPKVRLWAVHSVACNHCKDDVQCPVDVVPDLVERMRQDPSLRVRRMATIMLGTEFEDARAIPVLREVLATEADAKLKAHAQRGLERLEAAGLAEPASPTLRRRSTGHSNGSIS